MGKRSLSISWTLSTTKRIKLKSTMSQETPNPTPVAPDGRPFSEQPEWRREFPIDVPKDNDVSRRNFTQFLGLTSLAFVVGQFWILLQNWLRNQSGEPAAKKIADLKDIPVGNAIPFDYPEEGNGCLLVRLPDDAGDNPRLLAYGRECTHLSCAVVPDVGHNEIHCPCHHGIFDLTTGRPIAGPPRRPLTRIQLEVRGDSIYATGLEFRTV